jgi:acylphosphatase
MRVVRRYRVRGRVQGVGFRAFVWREARDLGVDGWVRNRRDGTVEALAAGDREQHHRLRGILERGPRMSRVDSVEVAEEGAETSLPDGFTVEHDR